MNKQRLMDVAKALRESPNPDRFDMGRFGHGCKTPACAIGHYALRPDLQDEFYLTPSAFSTADAVLNSRRHEDCWAAMRAHFAIDADDVDELFETAGCGKAKTANEAARYIERFVGIARPLVAMGARTY